MLNVIHHGNSVSLDACRLSFFEGMIFPMAVLTNFDFYDIGIHSVNMSACIWINPILQTSKEKTLVAMQIDSMAASSSINLNTVQWYMLNMQSLR